jgi:DNA-binding NarL/FixJ family response regulator
MSDQPRVVAFDLDAASLVSIRKALPDWEIETLHRATAASLAHDWNAAEADLLVVSAGGEAAENLRLCRFLVLCGACSTGPWQSAATTVGVQGGREALSRWSEAPLLVLVPSGQEPLVRAAYEAVADRCLVLPVHAREVASAIARLRQGNRSKRQPLMFCLGPGPRHAPRARSRNRVESAAPIAVALET